VQLRTFGRRTARLSLAAATVASLAGVALVAASGGPAGAAQFNNGFDCSGQLSSSNNICVDGGTNATTSSGGTLTVTPASSGITPLTLTGVYNDFLGSLNTSTGAVSFPASQAAWVSTLTGTLSGVTATIQISDDGTVTGTYDPTTGAVTETGNLTVTLDNKAAVGAAGVCTYTQPFDVSGTISAPKQVNLTYAEAQGTVSQGSTPVALSSTNGTGEGCGLAEAVLAGATQTLSLPVTVFVYSPVSLPTPTLSVSPTSGNPGTTVSFTGTGYEPDQSVTVAFTTPAAGKTVDSTTVTSTSSGDISGSLSTANEATGVNPLVASYTYDGITLSASASYTVTAPYTCTTDGTTGTTSCSISQVASVSVQGAALTITENAASGTANTQTQVVLSKVTLNGSWQTTSGTLNPVTVVDARGTLAGWTLTGQFTARTKSGYWADNPNGNPGAFENETPVGNPQDNYIRADQFSWTPSAAPATETFNGTTVPEGRANEVTAGAASTLSSSSPTTLCQAAAGGGGGTFVCSAPVSLNVPPWVAAGTYAATLNLVVG